ncbi:MAG TPA: hypothetical protein VEN79_16395 [Terriglobia bacterium]|nr:hypothetical protein [Terriglobia bacterium]
MPQITVTLVDHTNSPQLMPLIMQHLGDILRDLLFSRSEQAVVNIRSVTTSPAGADQDLVLHFVDNIASSYVAAQMPGPAITPVDGGVTRPRPEKTGSEFYKFPTDINGRSLGQFKAIGYAKLAAHEAMHNVTRLDNSKLHPQGGIGGSPPHLPVNDANRKAFQAALGNIPKQLL